MKKVQLMPMVQNGFKSYGMVADPRHIVKMMKRAAPGATQEYQRPWILKKVKEIARYVVGKMRITSGRGEEFNVKGLIPTAPVLNIAKEYRIWEEDGAWWIDLPETEEEIERYKDTIEVIDGQHRLLAFAEDLRDPLLTDSVTYEMLFNVYDRLTLNEKQELFMTTNEKQSSVSENLLRQLRKMLNILGSDEEVYDLTEALNKEDLSPLKGRIMVGAERIPKGYKEGQLSKILKKSKVYDHMEQNGFNDRDKKCRLICIYLNAWCAVCKLDFQNPDKNRGTKVCGLRYMFTVMPEMMNLLFYSKEKINQKNFEKLIRHMMEAVGAKENVFVDDRFKMDFRGETATEELAKAQATALCKYEQERKNTSMADLLEY